MLASPPLAPTAVSAADLARLQPLSPTWLGKSQQTALEYQTALEVVADRRHAERALLQQLNPGINWSKIAPGRVVAAPAVTRDGPRSPAGRVETSCRTMSWRFLNTDGRVIGLFPVSIAQGVYKRPVGILHVTDIIPNPNYTFDPDVFPESAEARELGRKLTLPPGPRNPVGLAWIGLDRPGYGIHGTPAPEKVGRTESHGCFRLANWDALTFLDFCLPRDCRFRSNPDGRGRPCARRGRLPYLPLGPMTRLATNPGPRLPSLTRIGGWALLFCLLASSLPAEWSWSRRADAADIWLTAAQDGNPLFDLRLGAAGSDRRAEISPGRRPGPAR